MSWLINVSIRGGPHAAQLTLNIVFVVVSPERNHPYLLPLVPGMKSLSSNKKVFTMSKVEVLIHLTVGLDRSGYKSSMQRKFPVKKVFSLVLISITGIIIVILVLLVLLLLMLLFEHFVCTKHYSKSLDIQNSSLH